MKKVKGLALLMACIAASTAVAQDNVEGTVSADFVNQYIWRGQDLGDVSVQPTLGVAYKGFSLTAWGSVGGFHIGITDYWFNVPNGKYFHYDAHSTSHVFEGNIGYDFGPVALNWYTNFAGNDGQNKSGKRAYSSYVEASVPFKLADLDWTATVGAVPYATSFYAKANGFAVTNVSLRAAKDIQVTRSWSIPLFAGITANPSTQKAYLVCGFTLRP